MNELGVPQIHRIKATCREFILIIHYYWRNYTEPAIYFCSTQDKATIYRFRHRHFSPPNKIFSISFATYWRMSHKIRREKKSLSHFKARAFLLNWFRNVPFSIGSDLLFIHLRYVFAHMRTARIHFSKLLYNVCCSYFSPIFNSTVLFYLRELKNSSISLGSIFFFRVSFIFLWLIGKLLAENP